MAVSTRTSKQQQRAAAAAMACLALFVALSLLVTSAIAGRFDAPQAESTLGQQSEAQFAPQANEPFYVLLIGSDSRKGTALYTGRAADHSQVDQHSDIMTLVRVDTQTHTLTLVTIPRDTPMPNGTGKINAALLQNDPNQVVSAVELLTGVDIQGYLMTDFAAFPKLVDSLGGVTVDVYADITETNPTTGNSITVKAGANQTLNGDQALALARSRKQYDGAQDAYRQLNVRNIEQAIIGKALDAEDFDVVYAMVGYLRDDCQTNIDYAALTPIITDFVGHAEEVTFYSCTGPYEGDYYGQGGEWLCYSAPDVWASLMAAVDAGEDPAGIVEAVQF